MQLSSAHLRLKVRLDEVSRLDGSLGVLFDPEAAARPGQPGDHQSVPGAQDLEGKKNNFIITLIRIRIPLNTLMRIRIKLFTLMRFRIRLTNL
jgi:hypothetical protein